MTKPFSVEDEYKEAQKWKLTDEDIERAKALIGVDTPDGRTLFMYQASENAITNYARGIGDDNPLYLDPDYGKSSRWGVQVAPQSMAEILYKRLRGDKMPADVAEKTKGIFRGITQFVSGSEKFWYHPIYPGDELYCYGGVSDMEVKPSEFSGRTVTLFKRRVKFNQRAEPVYVQTARVIHAERSAAAKKGKYMKVEPTVYTDELLGRIDAIYAAEERRGAVPRYWEDVEVGEAMPDMVKGPLLVSHVISYHAGGYGLSEFGLYGSRLWHKNRKRIPPFYIKNEQGVPDVAQRVHWDNGWAQAMSNPMAYDYGVMREAWLNHYLSDWVGDDGFIFRQYDEMRKFNYIGDTQFLAGKVVGKRIEDGRYYVDLELSMTNQRDELTTRGEATVVLPSRDGGPVILPTPSLELQRKTVEMYRRHCELARK